MNRVQRRAHRALMFVLAPAVLALFAMALWSQRDAREPRPKVAAPSLEQEPK